MRKCVNLKYIVNAKKFEYGFCIITCKHDSCGTVCTNNCIQVCIPNCAIVNEPTIQY